MLGMRVPGRTPHIPGFDLAISKCDMDETIIDGRPVEAFGAIIQADTSPSIMSALHYP